jgi:hypothetical protein
MCSTSARKEESCTCSRDEEKGDDTDEEQKELTEANLSRVLTLGAFEITQRRK